MKTIKIAIASDHAGFDRKQAIIEYLKINHYQYKDFGAYNTESSDYPDYAHPLAIAVTNKEFEFGITLCGSGNGINMSANKHQGIRSAICWLPEIAQLARLHNDANVCALPARYITDNEAVSIVDIFLNTSFEGGRHLNRINKIPLK